MQVKKFEARSMKEALEMVKTQLGPDAIILSAKDNSKSFGLVGQGSVEITAAASEATMQKKKFVESRLKEEDRKKFSSIPAKTQKQIMNKMVDRYVDERQPKPYQSRARYIEIDDEAKQSAPVEQKISTPRSATQYANIQDDHRPQFVESVNTDEVKKLREELAQLKSTLTQFQKVPQSMVGQHPGADYGLNYEFSSIFEKLISAGIAPEIAAEILNEAQKQMPPMKFKNKSLVDAWVAKFILDTTKISEESSSSKIHVFVGPSGAGKTSTLVKMASHFVVNEGKKVALVTTDTLKVGASDQLKIYAQILNVPFAVIRNQEDWDFVQTQLRGYDHILCDCPGLGLRTIDEISWLKSVLPQDRNQTAIHLVLNCLSKDQDLTEIGRRYSASGFKDVIFTSLDDSIQHGCIYNFIRRFDVPVHSFGIGSNVPEDYELATRERVLDLIFKLSKVKAKENSL